MKRFIGDILIIWTGTEESFLEFFNNLNSYHSTIKFDPAQHNSEDNSCEFRIKSEFLLPRNYHSKVIDSQFNRVRNLPGENYKEIRKNALKKKLVVDDDELNVWQTF